MIFALRTIALSSLTYVLVTRMCKTDRSSGWRWLNFERRPYRTVQLPWMYLQQWRTLQMRPSWVFGPCFRKGESQDLFPREWHLWQRPSTAGHPKETTDFSWVCKWEWVNLFNEFTLDTLPPHEQHNKHPKFLYRKKLSSVKLLKVLIMDLS